MSLLYKQTTKHVNQVSKDISTLSSNLNDEGNISNGMTLSLIGTISTTLTSINRLLNDFDKYINNQTEPNAKEKNRLRYERLFNEYEQLRTEFQQLKKKREDKINEFKQMNLNNERNGLFEQSTASGIDDNPYNGLNNRNKGFNDILYNNNDDSINSMMDQENKLQRGNARLDEILEMGRAAFDDIVEQNETLFKVRDKMSQGLETLGVSHQTVGKIEKVLWEDKIIFYVFGSLTLFIMYLIWKYLG